MKIFGIGLARTGSSSLSQALMDLGYSSCHFPTDYSQVDQYDSLTDTSVTIGYRYLDFMLPNSKFILTIRDVERWLGSMHALLDHLNGIGIVDRFHQLHVNLYRTTTFESDLLRDAYTRHIEEVRMHFRGRPTQLLELDVSVSDPYSELCPFLGLQVTPGKVFPHLNDRKSMLSSQPDSLES